MGWRCTCFKAISTALILFNNSEVLAQPKVEFKKTEITISGKTITVELAETETQRNRGLMYRDNLPADQGMLFIFESEQPLSFWMKNTYIDLSIGYFDKNRTLVDIQDMKKTSVLTVEFPSYESRKPAQYALEMNQGWFKKNKIKLGARFEFKKPNKSQKSGEVIPKSRSKNPDSSATN